MKNSKVITALAIFGTMGIMSGSLIGCAEKAVDKNIDAKVAQAAPVSGTAELRTEAKDLIENSSLKPEQKAQLRDLSAKSGVQSQALREESLKLRSLLIKEVLSEKYNKLEVSEIQKKIKKVEDRRLALMFDSIDKANSILGRETKADENARILDQMMLMHSVQN